MTRTPVRFGEILVNRGLLTEEQVETILEEQKRGGRPFGDLAERLFDVSASAIERAWVEQFALITEHLDPRSQAVDPEVHDRVTRRQAWQFGFLPLRMDGSELVVATTSETLLRAVRFAGWSLSEPVYFVLAEPYELEEALTQHYDFPGMTLIRAG